MRMSRKRDSIHYNYNINSTILKPVNDHPYLGVHLSSDLRWNVHVSKITSKANGTLAFLRRNLSMCSKEAKSKAYKTLVRPQLEYISAVWDPHTAQNIKKLEDVQRRAARFAHNNYDYHHTSVTKLVKNSSGKASSYVERSIDLQSCIKQSMEKSPSHYQLTCADPLERQEEGTRLRLYSSKQGLIATSLASFLKPSRTGMSSRSA